MKLLLLLSRVPAPEECARTAVDSEWLLQLADHHELVVAVDETSPGLDALRDAGLTVHVSDKRHVYLPGGGLVDADEAFARWVESQHDDGAFDLVAASAERPFLGRVRAALPGVTWAALAATGPGALAARLSLDTGWLAAHGHDLWRAASNVAAADVVVSPVAPGILGLRTDAPVFALLPTPAPNLKRHVTGDLVVVVATGASIADAAATIDGAVAAIDGHASTTIVVLYSPAPEDARDVGAVLADAVPSELEQQTILVPVERHGRAGDWLDAADAIVLADTAELLVPAVARRAAIVPTALLGPDRGGSRLVGRLLTGPHRPAPTGRLQMVQWTSAGQVARELAGLRRQQGLTTAVLYADDAAGEAARWLGLDGLTRYDVVVGAAERLPWSMPDARRLDAGVVALHRRTWNTVAAEVARIGTLEDLVARLADVAGAGSHTLGLLPSGRDEPSLIRPSSSHGPLPLVGGPLVEFRPPLPAVPDEQRQNSVPVTPSETPLEPTAASMRVWARRTRWPDRARIALPWRLGLADAIRNGAYPQPVAAWARDHTVSERMRLLLPWKWGLLPRAMEGRW